MSEQILYAKASVERKPEYRQQTLILRDGDGLKARKIAIGEEAKEHIRNYKKNYEILTKVLKENASVSFVPCTENEDGSVDFPFCHAATLADKLADRNPEEYIKIVSQFIDTLTEAFGTVPFTDNEGFKAFYGDIRLPENLEALAVTNADMNFDNVFCNEDGTYTIIDYEWIFSFPVPLTYLIYRSLLLDPAFGQFTDEGKQTILDHFGITESLREQFDQMELAFLRNISPEEYKLDYFARIPEARKTVIHDINALLRLFDINMELSEANKTLADSLTEAGYYQSRPWYKVCRRLNDGSRKMRSDLRTQARKDNAFGRTCSFALLSVKEGPVSAYQKVSLPRRAKIEEKRYLKRLEMIQQEEKSLLNNAGPSRKGRNGNQSSPDTSIKISILVPLYNTPLEFLREMVSSVQAQTYPNWELCLADGSDDEHGSVGEECLRFTAEDSRIIYRKLEKNGGISENSNACIEMATGEYFALFDHDDLLQPNALSEAEKAIREQGADFVYSDEFVFASPEKTDIIATHFKPDFSPESLLSNNYICHLSVFKASLLEKAGKFRKECDGSQDHDLILRLTGCAEKVVHIPKVLYFWRSHPTSVALDIGTKTYAINAGKKAVRDFLLTRKQIDAVVESAPEYPTLYHVRYPIEGKPSINIILDCSDMDQQKISERIRTLRDQTEYQNCIFTAIIAGEAPETEADLPVTWIHSDTQSRPERLNETIRKTEGEYIILLASELDCLNRDWLTEMLMLAQQKQIGAVGAKILFEDDTLRHGGLILGLGKKRVAGRSHFGVAADNTGYFGQLAIVGNVSAVSAECVMFRRSLFDEIGGFRPDYRETLFDVDFCLQLAEKGYRNLYTPFAKLRGGNKKGCSLNYGSEYREYAHDARCFSSLWKEKISKPDPYYNPNLTLDYPDYSIRI